MNFKKGGGMRELKDRFTNLEKNIELIMRKLDICRWPEQGHICHQCSMYIEAMEEAECED